MVEFTLTARSALGGYSREWPGAALVEVEGRALVSLAGGVTEALGVALPGPGRFAEAGGITAYWMGPEQWFIAADEAEHPGLRERLGEAAPDTALTEQSDSWAQLRLSGPGALAALERLCPLDLAAFEVGAVGRTSMEHLGAVIAREEDGFLLMSARSTARSFLHALETALESTSV